MREPSTGRLYRFQRRLGNKLPLTQVHQGFNAVSAPPGSIIIDILLTVIDERHGCRKFFLLLASTRKKVSNEPTTTVAGSVMYRNEANE